MADAALLPAVPSAPPTLTAPSPGDSTLQQQQQQAVDAASLQQQLLQQQQLNQHLQQQLNAQSLQVQLQQHSMQPPPQHATTSLPMPSSTSVLPGAAPLEQQPLQPAAAPGLRHVGSMQQLSAAGSLATSASNAQLLDLQQQPALHAPTPQPSMQQSQMSLAHQGTGAAALDQMASVASTLALDMLQHTQGGQPSVVQQVQAAAQAAVTAQLTAQVQAAQQAQSTQQVQAAQQVAQHVAQQVAEAQAAMHLQQQPAVHVQQAPQQPQLMSMPQQHDAQQQQMQQQPALSLATPCTTTAADLLLPQQQLVPSFAPSPSVQPPAASPAAAALSPSLQASQPSPGGNPSMAQLTASLMADPFIQALDHIEPGGTMTSPRVTFASTPELMGALDSMDMAAMADSMLNGVSPSQEHGLPYSMPM
jgi:hypothetical protein